MNENEQNVINLFNKMTIQFMYKHDTAKALTLAWNYVKHWLECECEIERIGFWEWPALYDLLQKQYETKFEEAFGVVGGAK